MKAFLILALVTFASAASAETLKNECFNGRSVHSYKVVDNNTISVRSFRKEYLVKTRFCHELRWADQVAFETFGSSSHVCRGDKLLLISFGEVKERCYIDSIELKQ